MLILAFLLALAAPQDELAAARAAGLKAFKEKVHPFLEAYCMRCHGTRPKGGVTLVHILKNPAIPAFTPLWKRVAGQVKARNMPPEESTKQPSDDERRAVLHWIDGLKYLSPKDPGEFVIRRLNRVEYGNTLRDLLGADPRLADELPEEVFGAGYANSISPLLMEKYLAVAGEALRKVDLPRGEPKDVARSFARRAYRRPPTDEEVDVLLRVHALAKDKGRSDVDALRLMLKAALVSPQFLFITPDEPRAPEQAIVPLGEHQLAARLSYFLWSAPPDAELSALADAGTLRDALPAQARRLLADPRSRALFDGFGAQWLGLDKLAGKTFDAEKFPQMTPALRAAMADEARLFFESVLRENRSLAAFIESDYSFLNETLAPFYGLDLPGPQMRKVALADARRGGILTMPGVLAQTSFPNRTSPVNRGVWVLEQVLGEHVPPPPADVPGLEEQDKEAVAALTLRQRTELHRRNPTCGACHRILDPIGFGLENFDAIGRWRDRDDAGGPIDPAGELPGDVRFKTPAELKRILAARLDDVARNLAARLLAYALCRQLEGYDEIVVDGLAKAVAKDDYRFQTLVVAVVTSYPFTQRRVHDLKGSADAK